MKDSFRHQTGRRKFLANACALVTGAVLIKGCSASALTQASGGNKPKVNAHLWVYASKFPPNWDVTPNLEIVFSDLSYAGIDAVELMENVLRHDDSVSRISGLIKRYNLPVAGSSYGADFWDKQQHQKILQDIKLIIPRLRQLNGKILGISVGAAKNKKTESDLDAQASMLKQVFKICNDNNIQPNLHNHTYEVADDMHDLKGTLARIPDVKLGPDLNWLIRGGINPLDFINRYGSQITYLHLRDQYADGKWTEYLGQGVTDFTAIAKALKEQGFKGEVAVELAYESNFVLTNPLRENWKISREYVRKTFGW
jgi:sugar phosphate isomerase/epimerase